MMQIKFRAWDTIENLMVNKIDEIKFTRSLGGDYIVEVAGDDFKFEKNKCILMQFAGLKDKRGKDIYEGDILTGYIPCSEIDIEFDIGIVEFKEGSFDIHRAEYLGGLASCSLNKSIEIIGNIYENPELVAPSKQIKEASK